ncbi:hypothetical protein QQ020_10550 [Fulvivirgaceae bacterium BMA12]|uniref:Uncharacterized protein n=1 Tax=Agaribacillus aureus TaxID=3051825 RepID=A0ABT8L447_9BACT|nr:hypothetical protein [Fulvivirgaceae bacterium BMA12]
MKINRDSVKFLTKIVALAIIILAGYAEKNQTSSPAQKGAVDLIITNDGHQKPPFKKVQRIKNQSV